MAFDGVLILGKELKRDRDRALRELKARAAAASAALRRGAVAVASLEAPLVGQQEAGSAIVAGYLHELGVPEDRIILRTDSRSTREEAILAAKLADEQGWSRLLVITAIYHAPRARRLFEEHLGRHRVTIHSPQAMLRHATEQERAWITAGESSSEELASELRVEQAFSAAERVLSVLPDRVRWGVEMRAAAWLRGR
ncbi:MAG: uncharacterized SAM-binding protein YcdF (DUF218 family) [Myxococcota bacterium]|jgi:uncharacterized SAM-binding protein YcdF (DUF218 family)